MTTGGNDRAASSDRRYLVESIFKYGFYFLGAVAVAIVLAIVVGIVRPLRQRSGIHFARFENLTSRSCPSRMQCEP